MQKNHPLFENNMINLYGEKGEAWLLALPTIVEKLSKKWGLSELKTFNNLSYHYVLSGLQGEQPIVLKLGLDEEGLRRESAALRAFSGYGAVTVLHEEKGILLLERAVPGVPLKSYFPTRDEEAIQIACAVIKQLHKAPIPKDNTFSYAGEELAVLDKSWNISVALLEKARRFRDQLLSASTESVLLHGDLHHDNILKNGDNWLVIDPKGVIGDPAYDKIGCLIREPLSEFLEQENKLELLENRLKIISDYFSLERVRILQWTFVQSVLACCWHLEDNQSPEKMLDFIKIIDELI